MTIFTSIIQSSIKAENVTQALVVNNSSPPLKCLLCIYLLIYFMKDQAKVQALLDSSAKVNVMILVYIAILSFKLESTNINT